MNKNFIHLVAIPFTGLGLHNGFRGNRWFKYRINIFKKYTLKSLINQTDLNFILWLAFRKEEKTNPLTIRFYKYLKNVCPFPVIFTYGGCFIWDDKYRNDNLLERLEIILPEIKEKLGKILGEKKWVYETMQPSDDMYSSTAMEEINKQEPEKRGILSHFRGFILNKQTQRVAEWNPTTINPPFYTIMYPIEDFLDPVKHFNYFKNSKSHEDVIRLFNPIRLPDNRYCVLVHEKNISTNWWHPFRGKVYSWKEGREIMKKGFNVEIGETTKLEGGVKETILAIRRLFFRFLLLIGFYKYAKRIKDYIRHPN